MDRVRHVCASESCATAEKYDADRQCASCRSVFYCSHECQRADWKGHKPVCKVAPAERASQMVRVGRVGGARPSPPLPSALGRPPLSTWLALLGARRRRCFNWAGAITTARACPRAASGRRSCGSRPRLRVILMRSSTWAPCTTGKGVPQDVARGVALLKQAAAGGSKRLADALRELGEAVPPGAPA
jgi:hypothetical protein